MTIHVTWTGVLAVIGAGALVFLAVRYLFALIAFIWVLIRWR